MRSAEVVADVDLGAGSEAGFVHVGFVDEHDAAAASDASVAVVVPIDGRVVLVMRAHRHHAVGALGQREVGRRVDGELGLAVLRAELTFAGSVVEVESAWFAYASVEVFEAWDRFRDEIADAIVIFDQPAPAHWGFRTQHLLGDARDDRRFAVELGVGGLEVSV